ncbi:MAG: hemerythrin family protein [Alphaproteobacteria bacterium]|nr:hemerythrin family protein [Alphaproteobacteria bacterium]MDE2110430.1 hemerythrin family protein [Alphaproteobacteria bacterium]MDE2493411.1 hemerythrin family protein [Alphaproteobacteria bacterium]
MTEQAESSDTAKPLLFLPASALMHHGHIDDDHRELIGMLNRMLLAAGAHGTLGGAAFAEGLQSFIARAERHFRDEEQAMAAVAYPQLAQHKLHHADVLRRLAGALRDTAVQSKVAAAEVYDLFNFILDDLLRADLAFKSFLDATRKAKCASAD